MKRIKITEICDFQGGTQPPKKEWKKEKLDGYVRMLQIRDFTQRHKNNVEFVSEKSNLKKCTEDDILIGRYGASIGKICTGLKGAYNVALIKTIPDLSRINRKFLYYTLVGSSFQNFILNVGSRAAQAGFNKSDLEKFEILLPPIKTQQKIVAVLEEADKLRQLDKNLVEEYEALSQSLFLEMFGDPLSNPKGNKVIALEDITSKITDGVHFKPEYKESGVPFISVKDITTGVLNFNNCKYISPEAHSKYYKRCNPEYLDILYTKVGATYGRPAIVDSKKDFSLYVSVALLKPNKELVNPYFLKEVMANPVVKRQADRAIKGIGVPDLHLNMIKKFLIPLPEMDIQNRFSEQIGKIAEQKERAQNTLIKSNELFNSLLQKAFKGDLV